MRLGAAFGATSLVFALLAGAFPVEGQPRKSARIGFLSMAAGPTPTMDISMGLRDLGWVEGRNLDVEYRWAANHADRLPTLAAELVQLKVDVIVTSSTLAALAAKRATTTIPIVVTFVADPVGSGLVSSLARPGGNITGVSTFAQGLVAKRLELLKAMVSGTTRVAVLWQSGVFSERSTQDMVEETRSAGRTLGLQLQFVQVRTRDDLDQAFSGIGEGRAGGLLVFPSPMLFEERQSLVGHAAKRRLPVIYPWREAADGGGLMSYATNFPDMYRRAAVYVDKILKGVKPADLPLEEPTRFELVVNLKTAQALRLTVPQAVLQRADVIIR